MTEEDRKTLTPAVIQQVMAAFPRTFFPPGVAVQPLKIGIADDLRAALPPGLTPGQIRRFLGWYVNRPAYFKALAQGRGRIDLTGVVVDTDIPDHVRQQAKERLEARRGAAAPRPEPTPKATPRAARSPAYLLNLEELYAMAVDAKLEITLKFSTLPEARPAGAGKMAFALKTPDEQFVVAEVGNKVWAKFTKATEAWPAWIAALTGTMGERTEKGFVLANPGLQVFERKPKAPAADAPVPTATAPTPAEPVASPRPTDASPPPPPPPVTVTTGAGKATVTTRNPLSLKRNASTEGTPG